MAQGTVTAIWSKPHYACAQNDAMTNWLTAAVKKQPDFMGLAQYESIDVNDVLLPSAYGVIGSGCYAANKKYGDVIGLAYDTKKWSLDKAFPTMNGSTDACRIPVTDSLDSDVMCAANPEDNPDKQGCCGCVGNPSYDGGALGTRAFAAGLFSKNDGSGKLCVVTASLPHPHQGQPFDNANEIPVLNGTVANICGNNDILFLGDTNLSKREETFQGLFDANSALHTLKDATDRAGYTCCADYDMPPPASSPAAPLFQPNRYASDRVALSCQSCKDVSVVGGASAPGGTCAAIFPSFKAGYPCNASKEEHCPLLTTFTWQPK